MGGDIAAWAAYKGFEVTLQDREQRFIDTALGRGGELFAKRVKDEAKRPAVAARLRGDLAGAGVAQADLVIEAIIENPQAKRELYQSIEPQLKPDALLTTNTSSIPLTELRGHIQRPAQFAGLHYFNPVSMMPLVEIVQHDGLDPANVARLAAFCKALDKFPVPVAGTPGFLVNRVLFPYLLEAATAYAEGVPGPVLDKTAVKFGMPMGPIELIDTVGLDVAAGVGAELAPFLHLPIPAALATVEPGKRGKKDGQGLYKWENGRAVKPEVASGYEAPADLEDRLILPLLNEAVACLHDGVVADADLLDAGVIFGTGFARSAAARSSTSAVSAPTPCWHVCRHCRRAMASVSHRARAGSRRCCVNRWRDFFAPPITRRPPLAAFLFGTPDSPISDDDARHAHGVVLRVIVRSAFRYAWLSTRLGAAVAALYLQGDVGDLETRVQQLGEGVAQAVAVGDFADHHVCGERGCAGGQCPDMQVVHVFDAGVAGQRLLYLRQIDAFGDAFQQHVDRLAQQHPGARQHP